MHTVEVYNTIDLDLEDLDLDNPRRAIGTGTEREHEIQVKEVRKTSSLPDRLHFVRRRLKQKKKNRPPRQTEGLPTLQY